MTTLLLSGIGIVQAALLLWAAILLSNTFLRQQKMSALIWCVVMVAACVALARFGAQFDLHRMLPGLTDCLLLVVSVAGIRFVAVSKEAEQLLQEHALATRLAAEAAEAELRAEEDARIRAAAAALEVRRARAAEKASLPQQPPRHLTPSILRSGAPSPRLSNPPRS
jgi:hypothetical protein